MECNAISPYITQLVVAIIKCVALVLIIPCAAAFLFSQSVPATLALITSTLIIEYGAAPIGIGLGLHPAFVLAVLSSVALGITLFLFDVFDTLGRHSERVARFLARSEEKAKKSTILSRYGMYGLVPCVLTLGFYVCPPVSCQRRSLPFSSVMLITDAPKSLTLIFPLTSPMAHILNDPLSLTILSAGATMRFRRAAS
jgi:hypothetical protein